MRPASSSPIRFASGGGHRGSFRGPNGGVPPGLREPSDPAAPAGPATPSDPASPAAAGGSPRKRATTKALTFPEQSKDFRDRKEATVVAEVGTVRAIGDKTFVWTAEQRWVDSSFDGRAEVRKIEAWSEDYFALLRRSDVVARYLSVGECVIVVLDGIAYEIVAPA